MSAPQQPPRPLPFFTGRTAPVIQATLWLVLGFLARGAGTIMFGQPGVRKSVHAAYIIACLLTGHPIPGLENRAQKLRILYVDFDAGWDLFGPLILAALRGVGVEGLPESFHYYSPLTPVCRHPDEPDDQLASLEQIGQSIAETVRQQAIDLVICDSLGQGMAGDGNSGQDVSLALRLGLNPARREGAAVLVIDHSAKGAVGAVGVPTPVGSQQKRAWARVTVALEREGEESDGLTRWTTDKSNSAHFAPFLTRAVFQSDASGQLEVLRLESHGEAGPRSGATPRPIDEAQTKVLDRLQDGPAARGEFPKTGTFDRAFKALAAEGQIQKDEQGRYVVQGEGEKSPPEAAPPHQTIGVGAVVQAPEREAASFD